jgi:hypothetical protein
VAAARPFPAAAAAGAELAPFAFEFTPETAKVGAYAGRTMALLPISYASDPARFVRNPKRDLRKVADADLNRVLGVHYNMGSRALKIYVAPEPPQHAVRAALVAEMRALGMTPYPSPIDAFRTGMDLLSLFDGRPDEEIPDLALHCTLDAVFMDVGPMQMALQRYPRYLVRTWMRGVLVVFEPRSRRVLWMGEVTEQGSYEVATRGSVQRRMQQGFHRFIAGFMRENTALLQALETLPMEELPARLR